MALVFRPSFGAAVNYADITAPTLVSAEVLTDGETFEIVFSERVTIGSGGNGGFTVTASGGAATLTYASGAGTDTLTYTISRVVNDDETFSDFDYTQPGNGVEDLAGNDLATFTNQHGEIANNSAQNGFTYLLTENLEGSNTDSQGNSGYNTPSVISSSASIDPQYTTSPAPLEGSHSLRPATSSRYCDFPIAGNPRSFFALVRPVSTTATTTMQLMSGSTTVAIIELTSSGKLNPTHGTVVGGISTDSFYISATWRLWIDYVPASGGSNGVLKIAFSTDNTKPTSGNRFVQLTTGDATLEVDTWRVGGLGSNVIFDKLRASATEIGSDPA